MKTKKNWSWHDREMMLESKAQLKRRDHFEKTIAEKIYNLPGVGFYGPTKSHGTHLDQVLCSSREEAYKLYVKHWKGEKGTVNPRRDMRPCTIDMCQWKYGWGTLYIPRPAREVEDAWNLINEMKNRGYAVSIYSPGALLDQEMVYYAKQWTVLFQYCKSQKIPKNIHSVGTGSTFQEATCCAVIKLVK